MTVGYADDWRRLPRDDQGAARWPERICPAMQTGRQGAALCDRQSAIRRSVRAERQNLVGRVLRFTQERTARRYTIAGVVGDLAEDGTRRARCRMSTPARRQARGRIPSTSSGPPTPRAFEPRSAAASSASCADARDLRPAVRSATSSTPRSISRGSTPRCWRRSPPPRCCSPAIGLYSLFMLVVVGARARDGGAARDRRRAERDVPAGDGRRRPAAGERARRWASCSRRPRTVCCAACCSASSRSMPGAGRLLRRHRAGGDGGGRGAGDPCRACGANRRAARRLRRKANRGAAPTARAIGGRPWPRPPGEQHDHEKEEQLHQRFADAGQTAARPTLS